MYFSASVLPAVAYIFTRVDHDCFNCFNRMAPRPYSFFQYRSSERLSKTLTDRESMLDDSFENMQLRASRSTGASKSISHNRQSTMRPLGTSMVYPCKHGELVYCSGCEVRGLADTGRISRNVADDITQQIIEDMAPQTLDEHEKESMTSLSRKSLSLYGSHVEKETKDRYSLTYNND